MVLCLAITAGREKGRSRSSPALGSQTLQKRGADLLRLGLLQITARQETFTARCF